jgi:hypothetical protein
MTTETTTKEFDIRAEIYREYVYADGKIFRIEQPVTLYILDGDSHRVVDMNNVCHRPERGYVGIRWEQSNGKPFSF